MESMLACFGHMGGMNGSVEASKFVLVRRWLANLVAHVSKCPWYLAVLECQDGWKFHWMLLALLTGESGDPMQVTC